MEGWKMDIVTAQIAYAALLDLAHSDTEEFWVLALGPQKTLLRSKMIFKGTVDYCLVHPRDIFRFACSENASSIIVAHNHPSGDTTPSPEDIRFTKRLLQVARIIEIPIIDHLIVTSGGFSSLLSEGSRESHRHHLDYDHL
jgi:DNA repair protein RadC